MLVSPDLRSSLTDRDASATANAGEVAQRGIRIAAAVFADILLHLSRITAAADKCQGGWVRLRATRWISGRLNTAILRVSPT